MDTGGHWVSFVWIELVGQHDEAPSRCQVDEYWETMLGSVNVVHSDSGVDGRRIILEDLGEPTDICTDEHVHPVWTVYGDLGGLKVEGYAYWGLLWGHSVPMTVVDNEASGTDEIGLKQAYGTKPGWIGMQVRVTFASQGDLAADEAYLFHKLRGAKISMKYKQHHE